MLFFSYFGHKIVPYTKCLCLKKESNADENLQNTSKSYSVDLHLGFYLYAKYQDPSQSSYSDILFIVFPIQKTLCLKKWNLPTENFRDRCIGVSVHIHLGL